MKARLNITIDDDRDLPCEEHLSVWDFYKSIGYDYKEKMFIS